MTTDLMTPPGLEQPAGRLWDAVPHGDEHAATATHQPGDELPREYGAEALSPIEDSPRATGILRAGAARPTCTPLTSAGTAP